MATARSLATKPQPQRKNRGRLAREWDERAFALAIARGFSRIEAFRQQDGTDMMSDAAIHAAAKRLREREGMDDRIREARLKLAHERTKGLADEDLEPLARGAVASILTDPDATVSARMKAAELAFRLLGKFDGENRGAVNIIAVGESMRAEIKQLQVDPSAQTATLDELQRIGRDGVSLDDMKSDDQPDGPRILAEQLDRANDDQAPRAPAGAEVADTPPPNLDELLDG